MSETFKPTPEMLVALRRAQWRSALKGSVPMQILLGRLYLGQTGETPPATAEEIAAALLALHEAASR
jgi:hypothetical protein